jgi:hypothetical protein
VNTAIRLADPPEEKLIILDNLGWYCDVTNIFIRQRLIQIVISILDDHISSGILTLDNHSVIHIIFLILHNNVRNIFNFPNQV